VVSVVETVEAGVVDAILASLVARSRKKLSFYFLNKNKNGSWSKQRGLQ